VDAPRDESSKREERPLAERILLKKIYRPLPEIRKPTHHAFLLFSPPRRNEVTMLTRAMSSAIPPAISPSEVEGAPQYFREVLDAAGRPSNGE
jgi:hypothetical protein